MNKAILITRPNHDLITTYFYYWSSLVIKDAGKKGVKILDLKAEKATRSTFQSYIKKHQPQLIFFNGHGNENVITGFNDEILIQKGDNENLLSDKIIYARSCDAASRLGPSCIRNKTIAFIGYKKKFSLVCSKTKRTHPLNDEIAKFFLEPSNLIPQSLLKGNSIEIAYQKSQSALRKNFSYMLSTNSSPALKDAAPYLWNNKKYQVALGNQEAKI